MNTKFTYIGLIFSLMIFVIVVYILYQRTNKLFESVYQVVHTQDVEQKLEEIHAHIKDMESSQRGFVISGKEEYLKPYYDNNEEIFKDIDNLKGLMADNPRQQNNIKLLEPVILKKKEFIDNVIKLKKQGDEKGTRNLINNMQGIALMDEINRLITIMKNEEYDLLHLRNENAQKSFKNSLIAGFSGAGLSIVILFLVFVILMKEIKVRKSAEAKLENEKKKLEKSESQTDAQRLLLKSVIDSIGDGILVVDEDDNFLIVNPASRKIFGGDFINKKHSEFFSNFESYLEDGETPYPVKDFPLNKSTDRFSNNGNIVCLKNKSTLEKKWLNLTFKILFDENDFKKLGVFAFRDITLQRMAEEKIRESENLLQNILDRLPVGVIIEDKEGRIIKENFTALEIWQGDKYIEINKYGNRNGWWTGSREQVSEEDWAIKRAFKKGEFSKDEEIEIECFDGTRKFLLSSAFPIYNKKGELTNAVEVNYDITKIKEDENEIIKLNKELNENYTKLSGLNKELEAFSYTVSHDLRAPLRHMQGYSDLMKKHISKSADELSFYYLDKISASAKEMGQLIDDLLVFSRIGRSQLKEVDINLDMLTGEIIYELKREIKDRKIKWNIKKLPFIKGDYFLIKTVLVNLISNAIKFTSKKELAEIEFGYKENSAKYEFYLKDNGAGFDMEYYDKLFGVFQRLHNKDEFEGTGIGLASVKRIITRHGGNIRAEAEENKGATFYFTLPRK